jgi:GNAT superfamily N-acetyltransferase
MLPDLKHPKSIGKSPSEAEGILSTFESAMRRLAARHNYRVVVSTDMEAFVGFLAGAPGNDGVSPVFNPAKVKIDDAFWIAVIHHDQVIGTNAQRFFNCANAGYYDQIRSGVVFGAEPLAPIELLHKEPGTRGSCSHSGGIYVHPSYRGTGLSWFLPHLGRAIAIRKWQIDMCYGMVFDSLRRTNIAEKNYGAQRVIEMYSGPFPHKSGNILLWSVESEAGFLVERIRQSVFEIANGPNKQMSDFAPVVRR